ncbi:MULTISPECIES: WYL domain-containing protein [Hyphomonas]|uniref:WYL domain-containing protein n=1 Tax=Hyphomonas TaxID=85 RepID=UPI0035189BC3
MASWNDLKKLLLSKQVEQRDPKFENAPIWSVPPSETEEVEQATREHGELHAEGQCFGICYVNSKQEESTRRIVVWGLKTNKTDNLLLVAKCLESRKTKSFRADRIKYCYDLNGEIFEPPIEFLVETFGLTADQSRYIGSFQIPPESTRDEVYLQVRRELRNELIVLAAMSECDGTVCYAETSVILEHVSNYAKAKRLEWSAERERKIEGYIRRLRPTDDAITNALDEIAAQPLDSQRKFASACNKVMLADGVTHQAELEFMDDIFMELFGHTST